MLPETVKRNKNNLGRLTFVKYLILVTMKMTLFYAE